MHVKSFVLVEKDQRYLLIQEAAAKWEGKWYLPGGSARHDETAEAAALRETMEEAGCTVNLTHVFFVKYSRGFFNRKVSVFYCATMLGDTIKTKADSESLGARWVSYEELDRLPVRGKLKEIIRIYRTHTGFTPVSKFRLEAR